MNTNDMDVIGEERFTDLELSIVVSLYISLAMNVPQGLHSVEWHDGSFFRS